VMPGVEVSLIGYEPPDYDISISVI
jgi:hypothetical protein